MTTSRRPSTSLSSAPVRRRLRPVAVGVLAALSLAASTTSASAAENYAAGGQIGCKGNYGGQADERGIMYVACEDRVIRYRPDGTRLPAVVVGGANVTDVAPSPDGRLLYINRRGASAWRVQRYVLVDGIYRLQRAWAPARYLLNNKAYALNPRSIATDAWGDLYTSNNGPYGDGTLSPHRIVKLAPDGSVITSFGFMGDVEPEYFHDNRGLTVSRDGRTILVADHLNARVQRFGIRADGHYGYTGELNGFNRGCAVGGGSFAAPSGVGIDPWGYIYVTDTSCRRLNKYRPDGTYIRTIATGPSVLHEIAIDQRGNVWMPEWDRRIVRAADNPVPGPIPAVTRPAVDNEAPAMVSVTVPESTNTRQITVSSVATDNVGIASMRLADSDGNWTAWRPFAAQVTFTLLDQWPSTQRVTVQVRDAAGHESALHRADGQQLPATYDTTVLSAAVQPPPGDAGVPTIQMVINNNDPTTATPNVTLNMTASANVTHVRFADYHEGNYGAWVAYTPNMAWTLSGTGTRGVYYQARDAQWNISEGNPYDMITVG